MGILNKLTVRANPKSRIFCFMMKLQVTPENTVINRSNCSSKFYSICNVENVNQSESRQKRNFSTEVKNVRNSSKAGNAKIETSKTSFLIPPLTQNTIQATDTITAVIIGAGYLTWVKMSIKNFTVEEWDGTQLPEKFREFTNEIDLLKLAHYVKSILPLSDIYVLEKEAKSRNLSKKLSDIYLWSMLTALLSVDSDGELNQKLYFQQRFVLNKLHNLIVGSERVSTREIITDKFKSFDENYNPDGNDVYSLTRIHTECLNLFKDSSVTKQEDLSLVLLLILSFIEVNVMKNEKSLSKIKQNKKVRQSNGAIDKS